MTAKIDANGIELDELVADVAASATGKRRIIARDDGTVRVLDNAGEGGALARMTDLPASLSDYENMIVVDAGGNGDYTTLSAALAASNASDVIYIISSITESNAITFNGAAIVLMPDIYINTTLNGCLFTCPTGVSQVIVALGSNVISHNSAAVTSPVVDIQGSGDLTIVGHVYVTRASANPVVNIGDTGTLNLNGAHVLNAGTGIGITFDGTGTKQLSLQNSIVEGGSAGIDIPALYTIVFDINQSTIAGLTASTGIGMSIFAGGTSLSGLITHSRFSGDAYSISVTNAPFAWSNAPVYLCVLDGALNNVTIDAGTAQGTCVEI